MQHRDLLRFSGQTIARYRFRSAMVLLAIALGVAAVIVLTALGEGARRYVLGEFDFLGADVVALFPGRNETTGGLPPVTGAAARDITLDEVHVLQRRLSGIENVAPIVVGSAEVSFQQRAREVLVMGTTAAFVDVRQMQFSQGRNLRSEDIRRVGDECIIGETLRDELFGRELQMGELIRVADSRCRVVGVLAGRGDAFGLDLSDSVMMPVASAQRLFDIHGLLRVIIQLRDGRDVDIMQEQIAAVMAELHQGERDITVVSPKAMLETFDDILSVMTLGVAAIAFVSLLVAGILIMNITVISVAQRTNEIGLLKALGASSRQVMAVFLTESVLSAGLGALLGVLLGGALVMVGRLLAPSIDFVPPLWSVLASVAVALISGVVFSWLPVRRASCLAPVTALQKR
ncbi:ABC transporter permease [Spongiibacter nanhainus]|uniref:ABC transporter permease n=1 Tax=Spongiibacter nanhainus TaxID=2794344 RepID=A0A7T4URN5_9GAMM|nr:ABC transporter permease [Spongiibacter nanhainus]QQD19702.1 ABC transporter permease [Spongiibacter nanhainus]